MKPANDNLNVTPYIIETQQEENIWWLVIVINGVQSLYTPDQADEIYAAIDGAPNSELAVEALQYSAYRCRMFNAGLRA